MFQCRPNGTQIGKNNNNGGYSPLQDEKNFNRYTVHHVIVFTRPQKKTETWQVFYVTKLE